MQGGSELILIWLGAYVAGVAIWFFIVGWHDLQEEMPGTWLVMTGFLWPVALLIFSFMFLGVVSRGMVRKKQ